MVPRALFTRAPPAPTLARILALTAIVLGLVALVGWIAGSEALRALVPGQVTMKTKTALALVALGAALLLVDPARAPRARRAGAHLAGATALLGAATASQYVHGLDLGLDELLLSEPAGAPGTRHPNRMAANTAAAVILLGIAVASLAGGRRRRVRFAHLLVLPVLALAGLALVGYVTGVTTFYGVRGITQMAVPTAIALVALALGVLTSHPYASSARLLFADGVTGMVARRLAAVAVAAPIALAALLLAGQDAGLYGPREGVWLYATAMIAVLLLVTWRLVLAVETAERGRAQADEAALVALDLARRDELTGLHNRRGFDAALERFLGQARRYGVEGAMLAVDLDAFKHVNDRFGHHAGDEVLRHVARALSAVLRTGDVLARVGGDEFAVMLPHASLEDAAAVADKLVGAVAALRIADLPGARVGASVGIALVDATLNHADAVRVTADQAMYRAKHAGGARAALAGGRAQA